MNGLEEVQGYVKNFISEKQQMQQQITEIENKRTQLAGQRNEKKNANGDWNEINNLGRQISELGNQSQELQNKLDSKSREAKVQINFILDNLVAEGIRRIRIANGEIQDLENRIEKQKERQDKYQLQKQEFYLRFGRMPELSEKAVKESKLQEKDAEKDSLVIEQLKQQIDQIETEITELATVKRNLKNGNWSFVVTKENDELDFCVEELNIAEMEPIEEFMVEEFGEIEEMYVEEFEPIEEIKVESFEETEAPYIEFVKDVEDEQKHVDEIEELAKAIVEEIVAQQTSEYNVNKIDEKTIEEDIIAFEEEEKEIERKEKVIIPLFGQKATISNIIVKFEEGNLVYKAQMSDEEEIKIYPAQLGEENVLLRDKQNREECKEILINHAISEYKVFDKKVVNKIDPLVCELLIECAERYGYNAQELVYNYAMSFADGDLESIPGIIYNLSYIDQSNLSRKEKAIINKICKNARKNSNIDVIEAFSGFRKIKYVLKRIFAVNNVKVLPEAKY